MWMYNKHDEAVTIMYGNNDKANVIGNTVTKYVIYAGA